MGWSKWTLVASKIRYSDFDQDHAYLTAIFARPRK